MAKKNQITSNESSENELGLQHAVSFSRENGEIVIRVKEADARVDGRPIQLSLARRGPAVVCPDCEGTGRYTLVCRVCGGEGCDACSTTAKGYDRNGRVLHDRCEGRGCDGCGHKGYFNAPCRSCDGRGENRRWEVMRDITIPLDQPKQSGPGQQKVVVHSASVKQKPATSTVADNLDAETAATLEALKASAPKA